jgi:hypothetical protein
VSRSRHSIRQLALGAIALPAALSSCAQPMIQDGAIRETPMREIVANTVRARAIEPKGPINARVVSRRELLAILSEAIDEWKTPSELANYERALNALGLWPADRELYAEALAVYGEESIGIYVPSKRELLLVSDARTPRGLAFLSVASHGDFQSEFALSHEIIHLLQHQAYPELMDPDWMPKNSDDLEAAIQAALEGDAMRFAFDATGLQPPKPEQWATRLDGRSSGLEGGALAEAPALIRLAFDFPYVRGYAMAWSEEFQLLESPPISTEQAMHDDRRLEAFLQLDLTKLEDRLPAGCRTLQRNTIGELQISAEWVWWTAWDSARDAAEFADAYPKLAPAVAARASSELPVLARMDAIYVVVTSSGFAAETAQRPPPATRVADLASLQALLRRSSTEERAVLH